MLWCSREVPPTTVRDGSPLLVGARGTKPCRGKHQGMPATRPVSRPSSINLNLFRSSSILAQIAYFLPSSSGVPCDVPANRTAFFPQPALYFGIAWLGHGETAFLVPGEVQRASAMAVTPLRGARDVLHTQGTVSSPG